MFNQPLMVFRCDRPRESGRPCNTRLLDQAMAPGSVVEVKCECNRKYVLVMTTMGLLVAERRNVTYTPVPEAVTGAP